MYVRENEAGLEGIQRRIRAGDKGELRAQVHVETLARKHIVRGGLELEGIPGPEGDALRPGVNAEGIPGARTQAQGKVRHRVELLVGRAHEIGHAGVQAILEAGGGVAADTGPQLPLVVHDRGRVRRQEKVCRGHVAVL